MMIIPPRVKDLGGFSVRRILPYASHRMVGPFIFFDHMGPAVFEAGTGMDVRPHPHIGLATLTWLFDGQIMHRDSLGSVQPIRAGEVNWMTAGRGIVHSERTPDEARTNGQSMEGLQIWIALPDEHAEAEPVFLHYPKEAIPVVMQGEVALSLVAGTAFGATSPVTVHSPLCYLVADLKAGQEVTLPDCHPERAVYVVSGQVSMDDTAVDAYHMAVASPDQTGRIIAREDSRIAIIGGSPVGDRHVWWNFVSSSPERIEQAKADWKEGRFAAVPGEDEFIPLPE